MSLKFDWKFFDVADLQNRCKSALTESIAQTPRPPAIEEQIRATSLDFGTDPPDITFESVQSVSLKRTHITFSLKYQGDASLLLETAIQANPLREPLNAPEFNSFVKPKVVGALVPLVLPFKLKLHNVVLDSVIDFIYTSQGAIIFFREDPIKNLDTESSLDMVPGVKKMIGQMLKQELLTAFYEDIPESVWATTSPTRTPPHPFFGIGRWPQFGKEQTRWSALSLTSISSPLVFTSQPQSLALPPPPKIETTLSSITSRAMLAPLNKLIQQTETAVPTPNASFTEPWRQFVQDTTLDSVTGIRKPRRRKISLRMFTPTPPPPPSANTSFTSLNTNANTPHMTPNMTPHDPILPPNDPYTLPNKSPLRSPSRSAAYTPNFTPNLVPPPEEDTNSDLESLEYESCFFNAHKSRRYTSPTKRYPNLNKKRTTSMQPNPQPPLFSSKRHTTTSDSPFF